MYPNLDLIGAIIDIFFQKYDDDIIFDYEMYYHNENSSEAIRDQVAFFIAATRLAC